MVRRYSYFLLCLVIIHFIYTMVIMVMPYFPFGKELAFLATKPESLLNKSSYVFAFYIHITTSFIALIGGLFQFIPSLIVKFPKPHRIIGMAYVYSILLFACPSGAVLAYFANGGIVSQIGFLIQCAVWFVLTFMAVKKAVEKQFESHINWMILSYAITLAAFSLRAESWLFHLFTNLDINLTYNIVTWLSWVGNLVIGILLVYLGIGKKLWQAINNLKHL